RAVQPVRLDEPRPAQPAPGLRGDARGLRRRLHGGAARPSAVVPGPLGDARPGRLRVAPGRRALRRGRGPPGRTAPLKSEIRNSKSERNPKSQIQMSQTGTVRVLVLGISGLGFLSDFEIRISDLALIDWQRPLVQLQDGKVTAGRPHLADGGAGPTALLVLL